MRRAVDCAIIDGHNTSSHIPKFVAMEPTSQSLSVKLRRLTGERSEVQAVQEVIEAAPDYMYRITGLPPGNADGQSTFIALPENKSYEDKFVYGIYWEKQMVGCIDVIRAYPKDESAWLGLLLIAEPYQRRGIGTIAYELIENQIRAWPGIQSIGLSVVRTNEQVLPFWKKMGFVETGVVKPYQYAQLTSEVIVLEKRL